MAVAGPVAVVPYDPEWPRRFEAERALLERVLAPWLETQFGLHLTEPGSDLWRERLAVRDALRNNAALAAEYEALKLRLAEDYRVDLRAYTAGKRDFVIRVLADLGIQLGRR